MPPSPPCIGRRSDAIGITVALADAPNILLLHGPLSWPSSAVADARALRRGLRALGLLAPCLGDDAGVPRPPAAARAAAKTAVAVAPSRTSGRSLGSVTPARSDTLGLRRGEAEALGGPNGASTSWRSLRDAGDPPPSVSVPRRRVGDDIGDDVSTVIDRSSVGSCWSRSAAAPAGLNLAAARGLLVLPPPPVRTLVDAATVDSAGLRGSTTLTPPAAARAGETSVAPGRAAHETLSTKCSSVGGWSLWSCQWRASCLLRCCSRRRGAPLR